MTAPTPPASSPVKLRRGQLVTFGNTDPILGGQYEDQGVVIAVDSDDAVTIRPLASFSVQVDPASCSPASADDVSPG